MLRSVGSKVAWVGRTASMVFGVALILGLIVGLADAALGANGQAWILGKINGATATTQLNGNAPGKAALVVNNFRSEAGSKGLQVNVDAGKAPLAVNPNAGKATNLSADKLDGKDSADLLPGGTLPAGATIRGNYEIDGTASATGQVFGGDSISFGYALPATPQVRFVGKGTTPPAECPGTISSPQASPGILCIYENFRSPSVDDFSPQIHNQSAVGAGMFARSKAAGEAFSVGSWAVTAPTAAQAQAFDEEGGGASQQWRSRR